MQARALTCCPSCANVESHHARTRLLPNLQESLQSLRSNLGAVGVVDLYGPSLCVFTHKATGRLPQHCFCQDANPSTPTRGVSTSPPSPPPPLVIETSINSSSLHHHATDAKYKHIMHHVPPHDVDTMPEAWELIDRLTSVDRVVYAAARAMLLRNVRQLEAKYRRRMLNCTDRQATAEAAV